MNNNNYQEYLQKELKPKFRGSQSIRSKVTPRYPEAVEREFQRMSRQYLGLFKDTLKKHLPAIMEAYKKERRGNTRLDDARDLNSDVQEEMQKTAEELEQKLAAFGLLPFIEKIAEMLRKSSVKDWRRIIRQTFGVDLLDEYYSKEMYEYIIKRWISENVSKIKSIPNQTLDSMKQIMLDGFMNGKSVRDIQKRIQSEYDVTKSKAAMLARDQIATLNSQLTQMQAKDAGCKKYRWSSSGDSRVRDCHRALDGKIFSWDDPPEMWYNTKERGRVTTGRKCHPGEDFCCRCVAIPIFDKDSLNIPFVPNSKSKP